MQDYITKEDLLALGVSTDDADKALDELNEKVAALVGEEIVTSLTPEDAEKLGDMLEEASEQEVADWVIERVPDYPEIIDNNTDIVLGDFVETLEK